MVTISKGRILALFLIFRSDFARGNEVNEQVMRRASQNQVQIATRHRSGRIYALFSIPSPLEGETSVWLFLHKKVANIVLIRFWEPGLLPPFCYK
jgi:hypothetical protein